MVLTSNTGQLYVGRKIVARDGEPIGIQLMD